MGSDPHPHGSAAGNESETYKHLHLGSMETTAFFFRHAKKKGGLAIEV